MTHTSDLRRGNRHKHRAAEAGHDSSRSEQMFDRVGCLNRHQRRAIEAGHDDPRPEQKIDRDGLGQILAFPLSQVQERLGISRSKAYEEIAAGRLRAVKCGTRTLIPFESGKEWLENLPSLGTQ